MNSSAKLLAAIITMNLILAEPICASERGIRIRPNQEQSFEYLDDFSSHKFIQDAFPQNLSQSNWNWHDQAITSDGSESQRAVTYRFFGDRRITSLAVHVAQRAKPELGGSNLVYLSSNGVDWSLAATSKKQKIGEKGWQEDRLEVPRDKGAKFTGQAEVWVRVVMANDSGNEAGRSNQIDSLQVEINVGKKIETTRLSQHAEWGRLLRAAGWKRVVLDWSDPMDQRPPYYFEDADGWLQPPGANPNLITNQDGGLPIGRAYGYYYTSIWPVSLAVFVETDRADGAMIVKITTRSRPDSSRSVQILWDGNPLATFDTASFFDEENFYVTIPGPQHAGRHEMRIICGDLKHRLLIKRISMIGAGAPRFVEKPKLPAGGSLELLSAEYVADPKPPADSQVVQDDLMALYEEHAEFGGIRAVVRNDSNVPVRIANTLLLDGKPVEASYIDLNRKRGWDGEPPNHLRGVLWYRVRPRLLSPGSCAQVFVRFRRRPAGDRATMTIQLENGDPLQVDIPYKTPGMTVDYVSTNEAMDTLYVYARRHEDAPVGNVTSFRFNGEVIRDAKVFGADFPGNVALVVAKLNQPLEVGDYHVAGVKTDAGKAVDAQFRVLPFVFLRSSIGTPPSMLHELNMNVSMWNKLSLASCEKYDVFTSALWGNVYDLHSRVAYAIGLDEPDGTFDPQGGRGPGGLGRCARLGTQMSGWNSIVERFAPKVATWAMLNHSARPLSWAVYGQWCDILSVDPYVTTFMGGDHSYIRESLGYVRRCCAPNRMFVTLETFGWGDGDGVPEDGRGPTSLEYRQNVVQAIGCGIKGLTSWVYTRSGGGWQLKLPEATAVKEEIGKMNQLIRHIERYLLIGTPIDLATSDAGLVTAGPAGQEGWKKNRVWVGSLLCGPDTIVLAAVNHIPASKKEPPTIEPAKNVTITVRLPRFLQAVKAFESTQDGLVPIPCQIADGKALLKLDSIRSGRVFVFRRL